MVNSVVFVAILAMSSIFYQVSAIDLCGLGLLNRCNPYNASCIITSMEPAIRQWFRFGRAEYFEDPVEPFFFADLVIPFNGGAYNLQGVVISGIGTSRLTDWVFDEGVNGLGSLSYTYNLDVFIKIDSVTKILEGSAPVAVSQNLAFRLGNIDTVSSMPLWFMTRCNGVQYMAMREENVVVKHTEENILTFESGSPDAADFQEFKYGVIQSFGDYASRILTSRFRVFCTQIGVNGYFDFEPHYRAVAEARAHARANGANTATRNSKYGRDYVNRYLNSNTISN